MTWFSVSDPVMAWRRLRGYCVDFKYASSAYSPVCPKPNGQSLVEEASGVESWSWAMLNACLRSSRT